MRPVLHGCLALALVPAAHAAGARMDLYRTDLRDDDATLTVERRLLLGGSSRADAGFPAGADNETGLRLMIFGSGKPWVAGIDISYFTSENRHLEMHVGQLAVVGGLRTPRPLLARHGHGLHPYALVGIAGASITGRADLGGIRTEFDNQATLTSSSDPAHSPFIAVGTEWQFSRRLGVVAEYRYRHFEFEEVTSNSWIFPTENNITRAGFDAGGLSIGISWLFGEMPADAVKMPGNTAEQPPP
ncbi:MAG: outer membrane protein [Pseudomonadota bacterium]